VPEPSPNQSYRGGALMSTENRIEKREFRVAKFEFRVADLRTENAEFKKYWKTESSFKMCLVREQEAGPID
jgi:hypothetical protein